MKKIVLIVVFFLSFTPIIVTAQTNEDTTKTIFTRGSGFVIRPEFCNGVLATIGYQVNPYVQISGSLGFGLGEYTSFVTVFGIRAYTSDKPWAAYFDYHVGAESALGISISRHTLIAGASYKDFDFGAGIIYGSYAGESVTALSLSIGYNIRCYKHR